MITFSNTPIIFATGNENKVLSNCFFNIYQFGKILKYKEP